MGKKKNQGDERVVTPRIASHASQAATEIEPSALQLAEPGQEVVNVVAREDVPPNGGYGWICAACVFFVNAHTWGINSVSICRIGPSCLLILTGMGYFLVALP